MCVCVRVAGVEGGGAPRHNQRPLGVRAISTQGQRGVNQEPPPSVSNDTLVPPPPVQHPRVRTLGRMFPKAGTCS